MSYVHIKKQENSGSNLQLKETQTISTANMEASPNVAARDEEKAAKQKVKDIFLQKDQTSLEKVVRTDEPGDDRAQMKKSFNSDAIKNPDDIDIYLVSSSSDTEEDDNIVIRNIKPSNIKQEVIEEDRIDDCAFSELEIASSDETEMALKAIFGIGADVEVPGDMTPDVFRVRVADSEEPSTSKTLRDPDSPPTGTIVALNPSSNVLVNSLNVENEKLKLTILQHEKNLAAKQEKLAKYKASLLKVDKKLASKKDDLAKKETKIEELNNEVQKMTKRYHKSVDDTNEKKKKAEKLKADNLLKQRKIEKLEEALKKAESINEDKQNDNSHKWQSLALNEKQSRIEELESLIQGKEESISSKVETIMTLGIESKSKDIEYVQLRTQMSEMEKTLEAEKKQKEDFQVRNEQLERTMLQKTNTTSPEVAERINQLEAQLKHLQEENVSLTQNSHVAIIQVLQEKENSIQLEKKKCALLIQEETEASRQKLSCLQLQNCDLMSQIQYLPVLQNKVKELERKVQGGTEATETVTEQQAGPSSSLFNAYEMGSTALWVDNLLPSQGLLSSLLQSRMTDNQERPGTSQSNSTSSSKTDSLVNEIENQASPRSDSGSRVDTLDKNPSQKIGLQKFSTLCSASFNVNQTQWSDSSDEGEDQEDITDGLLSLKGKILPDEVNQDIIASPEGNNKSPAKESISTVSTPSPIADRENLDTRVTVKKEEIYAPYNPPGACLDIKDTPELDINIPKPITHTESTDKTKENIVKLESIPLPSDKIVWPDKEYRADAYGNDETEVVDPPKENKFAPLPPPPLQPPPTPQIICDQVLHNKTTVLDEPDENKSSSPPSLVQTPPLTQRMSEKVLQLRENIAGMNSSDSDEVYKNNISKIRGLINSVEKKKKKPPIEEGLSLKKKKEKKKKEEKMKKNKAKKHKRMSEKGDIENKQAPDLSANDHIDSATCSQKLVQRPSQDLHCESGSNSEDDIQYEEERRVTMRTDDLGPTKEQLDIKQEMDFRIVRECNDSELQKFRFDDEESANLLKDLHSRSTMENRSTLSALSIGKPDKKVSLSKLIMDKVQDKSCEISKEKDNEIDSRVVKVIKLNHKNRSRSKSNDRSGKNRTTKKKKRRSRRSDSPEMTNSESIAKEIERIDREIENIDFKTRERILEIRTKFDAEDIKPSRSASKDKTEKETKKKHTLDRTPDTSSGRARESVKALQESRKASEEETKSRLTKYEKSKRRKRTRTRSRSRSHSKSRYKKRKHSRDRSHHRSRSASKDLKYHRTKQNRNKSPHQQHNRLGSRDLKYPSQKKVNQKPLAEKNPVLFIKALKESHECTYKGPMLMVTPAGVEQYYDQETQAKRVRLDGYGANGPPEILVNMMSVNSSIKVHFRCACMTCGKNIGGAATGKHFTSGACSRKAESLASGGLVFCSYCEVTGAHWVQACPLLVSFCFCCWVWGHNFLHHQVTSKLFISC